MKIWNFRQRRLVELCTVVISLGLIIAAAVETFPSYMSIARAVQSLYSIREFQTEFAVEKSFVGKPVTDFSNLRSAATKLPLFQEFSTFQNGNISILFSAKDKALNGQTLGFTFFQLESSEGYTLISWQCGRAALPAFYQAEKKEESSLDSLYTRKICAE